MNIFLEAAASMNDSLFETFGEAATYDNLTPCTVVRITESGMIGVYAELATTIPLVVFKRSEVVPVAGAALTIGTDVFTLGPRQAGSYTDADVVAHRLEG